MIIRPGKGSVYGKIGKRGACKKTGIVDRRKVKKLQQLLKVDTESEAVRIAIDESVANIRTTRSFGALFRRFS